MDNALIRLEGIQKVFRTEDIETHALSNIALTINRGEYVSISGPSGCGKSTLLSVIGLLDAPTDGKYTLAGQDVSSLSRTASARTRNQEIGFICMTDSAFLESRLPVGSGGQQQRVAVARALAGNPSVLLADEPTGNLDSKNAESVMQLLDRLHADGATICMVTHDPRLALRSNRKIDVLDGRVVADKTLTARAVRLADKMPEPAVELAS